MAMTKSLRDRIALANKYIRWAQENYVWGAGYFGSTWPVSIEYTDEITVSPGENIVTVRYGDEGSRTEEKFDGRDGEGGRGWLARAGRPVRGAGKGRAGPGPISRKRNTGTCCRLRPGAMAPRAA